MDKGWISIHRKMQEHWLWSEKRTFSNLEAWLDILITVNHTEKKVLLGSLLLTVKRGESVMSLDSWAKRWKWNKSKVRRFFTLLEKDKMIVTKNEKKTTRLTVCKYDSYQGNGNASETQVKRKRNADETQVTPNNNVNKDNNTKEPLFDFRKSLLDLGLDNPLVDDWLKVRKSKKSSNTETALNGFIKQVEKSKYEISEVLKVCVIKSWVSFNSSWDIDKEVDKPKKDKIKHLDNPYPEHQY